MAPHPPRHVAAPTAAEADLLAQVAASTFQAVVFDWDGTAVPDRRADGAGIRARVEGLCRAGVHVFVVSGTHVGNVDGQLGARPSGAGQLHLCLNRGSEVFEVGPRGAEVVWRRSATAEEDAALDRAAALAVAALGERGVRAEVVSQRLNRRKIDIIPDPAWSDPPKARIDELLRAVTASLRTAGIAGLSEVVDLAAGAARSAGLVDARITSDVKHVEIGLTDKSDSARWAAAWLAERGITGSLVLVGGDEFGPVGGVAGSDSLMLVPELTRARVVSVGVEPGGVPPGVDPLGGGPERFLEVLDAQLARRRDRRVPWIDVAPDWVVSLPGEAHLDRAAESIGTLANGWAAIRGSREEGGPGATPLFAVNGMYLDGPESRLQPGPVWTHLEISDPPADRRLLDLRTGVLARESGDSLRSVRFVSVVRPGAMALRAEGAADHLRAGSTFGPVVGGAEVECERRGDVAMARTATGPGGIAVAARTRQRASGGRRVIERLAAWVADPRHPPDRDAAVTGLDELDALGFDGMAAEHRQAWAQRWSDADVVIEGDPDSQLAARFALFHLLVAAADEGEAAVGARGLTGPAYGGHVFWDADVFVLPVLAAVRPGAARAMLEYRIRRLPAARDAARALGLRGARFPWESALEGVDVTPRRGLDRHGKVVPIRTGEQEEHIVADIAWAACEYVAWTGDHDLLSGAGRDLLVDTARFWASRVRVDADGNGHLFGLMGPDEYHEVVDDNAFTNVMARWNLRRAAQLVDESGGDPAEAAEAAEWRRLAATLVDGWDPVRGLYEQFAGYWDLEPLLVAAIAPPPVAADVVLGADRVSGSQLIKQPDVLMLHHLVPGEVQPGSLAANLAFYDPRTAHGSSLSPAIHAALFARAGRPDDALELFRVAARLDLEDLTGTTAGGLHLATMGGVWQALAYGFLGLRPAPGVLAVDPCLPASWEALSLRLRFGGHPIGVRAEHGTVAISCDAPITVRTGGEQVLCAPPGRRLDLQGSRT